MTRPSRERGSRERYEWLASEVAKQTDDPTAPCQVWTYAKIRNDGCSGTGHGYVVTPDGSRQLVHRVAFKLVHGHWPEPCCIHVCDNPPCFWVAHLKAATQLENIADMRAKGRGYNIPARQGEKHHAAILTEQDVIAIRAEYKPGYGALTKLGRKYGVTLFTIFDIVNGRSWTHLKS